MKTGLTKKQKATNIYFNEDTSVIEVCTFNTSLKNRLAKFSQQYPEECKLIDSDDFGCVTYDISKGRFSFRLIPPYSEERRTLAKKNAKTENLSLQIKSQAPNGT